MYRLLVPVDDDEGRAERQARFVAGLPGAADEIAVTVTHALGEAEREAPESMRNPQRVATVKLAVDHLEDAGIETTVREVPRPPEEGIIQLADEIDADGIVMGGRKRSPAGKAIFGSVTQSVILRSDRPVTVTGG